MSVCSEMHWLIRIDSFALDHLAFNQDNDETHLEFLDLIPFIKLDKACNFYMNRSMAKLRTMQLYFLHFLHSFYKFYCGRIHVKCSEVKIMKFIMLINALL